MIAVTRHSLIRRPLNPKDTIIEVADRWDRMTALYVLMTEPGVALASNTRVGGPLPLISGRQV